MELDPGDVLALDDGREALPVLAAADDVLLLAGPADERVHVIEGRRLAEARGQLGGPLERDAVPADVRELGRLERGHPAGQQAEACRALVLGRGLEEQLHAEADAEHGRSRLRAL